MTAGKKRYSALLLFQYRALVAGKSDTIRGCEKALFLIQARNAAEALRKANRIGKQKSFEFAEVARLPGGSMFFEFVGVLDLLELGIECDDNEMWYEMTRLRTPMERRGKLIPRPEDLTAFRNERMRNPTSPRSVRAAARR